jgi:RNA 2',3'-cyclic 3'-phosphodiesterase
VPVEDARVREALGKTRAALSGARDLKWVRDEHLHLTLRFFADLPTDRWEAVADAARAVCASAPHFNLEIRGIGRFPSHGPLRVVWAGLGDGRAELVALGAALQRELAMRGFPEEERPLSPHLTLARARDPRGSKEAARTVAAFAPGVGVLGVQAVEALVLYRSDLGVGPPVHTVLGRFALPA